MTLSTSRPVPDDVVHDITMGFVEALQHIDGDATTPADIAALTAVAAGARQWFTVASPNYRWTACFDLLSTALLDADCTLGSWAESHR
jgi:hypothetical protein